MTIVAVNTRLARRLRREFDEAQQRKGLTYWEPPEVLTWPAWLARLWEEMSYAGQDHRVLLSAAQERVIWEEVIRESAAGKELLNITGAAAAAADAWRFLYDWRLPMQREVFAGVPDTEAFFGWMTVFWERLVWEGFVASAELAGVVSGKADLVAGFEELTPAQQRLLGSTPVYELPEVDVRERWRAGCGDEVRSAAQWTREQLERNAAARVGVVLVDLAARRAAVARVFEEVLGTPEAFHVSAPLPLSEAPLVRAALLALQGDEEALARSPFFRHTAETGARSDVARRNRRDAGRLVWPKLDRRPRRASAWSAAFSRLIVDSGWPGARALSSEEYQAVESWKELLAEFARLDLVTGEMEAGSAVDRLAQMARDKGFGPEEEDEPVQVMGVLEAAGARFDALWIGGLHDGAWPAAAAWNPFVPVAMQRSVADQYELALRTTERLMEAAGEIVCSWPLLNGEETLRPSPFLAGIAERAMGATPNGAWRIAMEEFADDDGPPFAGTLQKGGTTVITDQSLCAFRAFARHRLSARGLEADEPGLSLRERGNVMHDALRKIWSEVKTQQALLGMSLAHVAELIDRCVAEALGNVLGHRGEQMRTLEGRRMTGLLRDWMRMERVRPEFSLVEMENQQTVTLGGLLVDVRMDRVDRYTADGSLALVDYKTGKQDMPKQWFGVRPEAPQLPLYAAAMEDPVGSVMYGRLAAGEVKLVGVSEAGEAVDKADMAALVAEWRRVVDELGAAFRRGDATVDPLKKACARCDLQGLCRVSAVPQDADE